MSESPPLSNYCDEHFKFSVNLDRHEQHFIVNLEELKSFARFMGFSNVKILSMNNLSKSEHFNGDAISRVHKRSPSSLPLKLQWYSIEIYVNENLLRLRAARTPNPDSSINEELNDVIVREIRREAANHFATISQHELVFHDLVPIITLAVIAYLTLPQEFSEMTEHDWEMMVLALVVIKSLLMNALTIISEKGISNVRPSLLEGVELERLMIASLSQQSHNITQLKPNAD